MGKTIIDEHFEWDEEKNALNIKKHGLPFEIVKAVFDDPYRLEFYDAAHSEHEDRFYTIGNVSEIEMLLVTAWSTNRGTRTRLISARLAEKNEEGIYYENWQQINT